MPHTDDAKCFAKLFFAQDNPSKRKSFIPEPQDNIIIKDVEVEKYYELQNNQDSSSRATRLWSKDTTLLLYIMNSMVEECSAK